VFVSSVVIRANKEQQKKNKWGDRDREEGKAEEMEASFLRKDGGDQGP
jgi:hypothetical protein